MSDAAAAPVQVKTPAKKAAKPKKPAKLYPKYNVMIAAAVTSLKERGTSRQAILKYLLANYKVGSEVIKVNARLKSALKAGVKAGTLKQAKGTGASGYFRLGEKKVAAKAKKPKAAAKKPKKAKSPKKAAKPKTAKPQKAKTPKKAAAKSKKAAKSPAKKAAKPKKAKTPRRLLPRNPPRSERLPKRGRHLVAQSGLVHVVLWCILSFVTYICLTTIT